MKTNRIQHTKKALLSALETSMGIVSTACKKVGINRSTFYEYLKNDNDFAEAVKNIDDYALDFAETHLLQRIEAGDTASIIFYLKTKGRKRGYVERQELRHSFDPVKEIEIKEQYFEIKPTDNKDI